MINTEPLRCGSSCSVIGRFDREVILQYAEAGISSIETALPFINYFAHDWKELKRFADDAGVELWSVHLPFGGENNMFNIADKSFCADTVRADERIIVRAGEAGMRAAVIHPNTGDIDKKERGKQFETAVKSFEKLVAIGRREGVMIAAEVLPRENLGWCITEMKALADAVPGLKICMDVNHIIEYPPDDFVRAFGDKIITVHMSDNDMTRERHWMPGDGKIDWKNIIRLLKSINYTGPFMYELGGEEFGRFGLKGIKQNYDGFIKGIIEEIYK